MGARKVLFITNRLYLGGLERVTLDLCRALPRVGDWEPAVHYLDGLADAESLRPAFREAGVRVFGFPVAERFQPERVLAIRRFVRRERISVLHTHDLGPLIYGSLVKLSLAGRVKLVHTTHSFVHVHRRKKARRYERIFSRFADELCVVSPQLKGEYRALGVRRPIHVCENGVFFPESSDGARARRAARKRLLATLGENLPADCVDDRWILCLARIDRGKGQDHVLKIWEALSDELRRRSLLIFVGPATTPADRGRLDELMARAPRAERVRYAGATSEPEAWRRAASVFVSGSEFEGMPLAPIEAAGAGLPCLLSDIAGHRLLAKHASLFPLQDPVAAASRLESLLRNGERSFHARWKSAARLREKYGAERMASRYAELYVA